MYINTVNSNKLKISLTDEEVSSIFGGYDKIDYKNPASKSVLDSFLNNIIISENFILDSKSLIVEIKQELSGCSIILTKVYNKRNQRRRLKIKGRVAIFDTSDDMLSSLLALYKSNITVRRCDLYLLNDKYYLIVYTAADDGFLLEYLENITNQKSVIAYTEEHGTPLYLGNAVKSLGKIFS